MTDVAPHRPPLAQVGSRYGVRDFMRGIDGAWSSGMNDAPWIAPAEASLKSRASVRTAAQSILDGMISGPSGAAMMSYEQREGRRLGKPYVQLDIQIGSTAVLARDDREDETVALYDCMLRIEADRTVATFNQGRFMMTRHALERMYEREGVPTGGMPDAIRNTMADVRRSIAFSTVAKLTIGRVPGHGEFARDRTTGVGALQLVPCSGGLLVVEILVCIALVDAFPALRTETRRSGSFARGAPAPDPRIYQGEMDGVKFQGIPMHVGRTYLSWDLLRPEQREYFSLFREAEMDVDLDHLARQVFGTRDMHRLDDWGDIPPLPDATRLRELLPRCASRSERNTGLWQIRPRRTT